MIHVYLHAAAIGHYREIVAELAGAITGAGLYDAAAALTCCVVGGDAGAVAGLLGERWAVVPCGALDAYEYPTVARLHAAACAQPAGRYLYLHTKGATDTPTAPRASWRRYMAHFAIDRWRESVAYLNTYDTVGAQIAGGRGWGHYAGNFWWARGQYLATLPPCAPRLHGRCPRIWAEDWLTCAGPAPRAFNWCHVPNRGSNRYLAEHHTPEALYRGHKPTPDPLPANTRE